MSDNENPLEEKLYTGVILGLFVCLGYLFRSFIEISVFDGLITIVGICLGALVIMGAALLQFDGREE